jgi:nicotinate-nucleotide adenylyltransferase
LRVGIFGGTFNPIHYGHLRAAEEVREKLGFEKIFFIPSGKPPLKTTEIADAVHRVEITRRAITKNRFFALSDLECKRSGKSYSVKTLKELKKMYPETAFFFILGIDAFLDIPYWWHPEKLISLTNFVIISRPRFKFMELFSSPYIHIKKKYLNELDSARIDKYKAKMKSGRDAILLRISPIGISSTEIRRLIKHGKSIKYLLLATVKSYIISNKLYLN